MCARYRYIIRINVSVIIVAIEAPTRLNWGIKNKFNIIFKSAPPPAQIANLFCLSADTNTNQRHKYKNFNKTSNKFTCKNGFHSKYRQIPFEWNTYKN